MIGFNKLDENIYSKVMEIAPHEGLSELTNAEQQILESIRDRYEVIIGIVDASDVGIDNTVAEEDLRRHRSWRQEPLLFDDNDLKTFFQENTVIGKAKIATFIYDELVEHAACGSIDLEFSEIEQMIADAYHSALQEQDLFH